VPKQHVGKHLQAAKPQLERLTISLAHLVDLASRHFAPKQYMRNPPQKQEHGFKGLQTAWLMSFYFFLFKVAFSTH